MIKILYDVILIKIPKPNWNNNCFNDEINQEINMKLYIYN